MRWYIKATIQFVLSKMPGGLRINEALSRRFGEQAHLGEHASDRLRVLLRLIGTARRHVNFADKPVAVEIGTGWAPLLPMLLGFAGARTQTFDVNRFLTPGNIHKTLSILRGNAETIATELGCMTGSIAAAIDPVLESSGEMNVEAMLEPFNVAYVAPSDATALPMEDQSVDLYVSNLVFAHIPAEVIPWVLSEMRRVLKHEGIAVHRIRMTDEFGGGDPRAHDMNFLKFTASSWNRFGNTRIKYNNRLRCSQYLRAFSEAGFELLESDQDVSASGLAGLKTMKVAEEFRSLEPEDLATSLLVGVWRKKAPVAAGSSDTSR